MDIYNRDDSDDVVEQQWWIKINDHFECDCDHEIMIKNAMATHMGRP